MSTITKMKWLQGERGRFKTRAMYITDSRNVYYRLAQCLLQTCAMSITDSRNVYTAYTAAGLCTQSGNMRGHHARISCHLMAHEGGWKDDKEETQGERWAHHKSSTGASITQASRAQRPVRTPSRASRAWSDRHPTGRCARPRSCAK